jgi:TolB-like protein/Flp pilus assembly protein TadD
MAGAVFISYASQDTDAARSLCEALRSGGVEVWFDQDGGLEHGDAWDAKIRSQIKECLLFIPIISGNTQARHEGYFRIEWELAAERAMGIAQGVPFILPVVIDDTREADALVPDRFRKVQWTRLKGAAISPEVRARLLKLWSHRAGVVSHEAARAHTIHDLAAPSGIGAAGGWGAGRYALLALAVAVAGAGGWWLFGGRDAPKAPAKQAVAEGIGGSAGPEDSRLAEPEKTVAILVFADASAAKDNQYLSEGISEELRNALASASGLKVSPWDSAFAFEGKEVPVADIAKQIGVAYLVEGGVNVKGSGVTLKGQLVEASGGRTLWSDQFDCGMKELPGAPYRMACAIAKSLNLAEPKPAAKAVPDPSAYQQFLMGRARAERASMAELEAALASLRGAVATAPTYGEAWVEIALADLQLVRLGGVETEAGISEARAALAKAALSTLTPEFLTAQGWLRCTGDRDWKGALEAFRGALDLRPGDPGALVGDAAITFYMGERDEGIELARRAAELDSRSASASQNLASLLLFAGELNRAEQAGRRAVQLAPDNPGHHGMLATILAEQGRLLKADQEAALETNDMARRSAVGLIAASRGQRNKALAQARQIEGMAQIRRGSAGIYVAAAEIYAALGERNLAFDALERAFTARDPYLIQVRMDFLLRDLRGDPRWAPFLTKAGLVGDQVK